ncbi:uncharacterized protein MELLADRAFT_116794 [Melampsora larici-populina 98AG31]|uniref:Aldehyde dehydrogenase n=1 Tax=Melampsora larici-populina (strain 98AG31 / pathotype 3-4-7) TaxID=747676 RepID=F4RQH7_MELLP|nr:uncharacterized protein MELLADRAFT_116794 [Melampsora larici-populina 98AG31]EGG05510.1 hypothetical protein MELLADRAFT_116794 [Melampsora larici-populina 98AG31]
MSSSNKAQDRLQFTPIDEISKICQELSKNVSNGITKTLDWRIHQLKQLGYLLQDNENLLVEALVVDLDKPKTETVIGELGGTINEVIYALKNLKSWLKPQAVKTDFAWRIARPKTYHEPKGLVLIYGTWNYPIALAIVPLIGAIAGGNAVILKPSEQAPAIAKLFTKLIPQYLDNNHIRVVNGAADESNALLDHKFDHIMFTGSGRVARIVAKRAAEHLTPVTLELGGKCPAIVFDDADFPVIARRLIWGKGVNAGQTCVAPDYILVSKKSEAKLIASLKKAMLDLYPLPSISQSSSNKSVNPSGGSGDNSEVLQFCKIINRKQFDRLNELLKTTKGDLIPVNGTLHSKADSYNAEELRMPLALVRNVKKDDPLMQEEIFGPIFPIVTYDLESQTMPEILRPISDAEPLCVYVFTQTSSNLELVRKHTRSGQIVCNDLCTQLAITGSPFGGIGQSGHGSYRGYHSFLTFTYKRPSISLSPKVDFLFKTRYPPYTPFKLKIFSSTMGPAKIKGLSKPEAVPKSTQVAKRTWSLL